MSTRHTGEYLPVSWKPPTTHHRAAAVTDWFLHHSTSAAQGTKVQGLWTCPCMDLNSVEGSTKTRLQTAVWLRPRFPSC